MDAPVTITVADGVGHIELNRPDQANSLDLPLSRVLGDVVARAAADDEVRSVLVSGAGDRFCAGGDISSFLRAEDPPRYLHQLATTADAAIQALADLGKPVVVAVHGAVAGAGLGLILAGDVVIAAQGTKFVFAYPSVGLTPDCGTSAALPRAMGLQRALAFALLGKPLPAEEALTQGLVTEVVPDALARARQVAATWAGAASGALGETRRLLRSSAHLSREELGRAEADTISRRVNTPEAQQLLAAFLKG